MTEQEARRIIARVSGAYGRPFRQESIDEWCRHLQGREFCDADVALDRIIRNGEEGPSIARILAEISAIKPRELKSNAGEDGCQRCGGLGFLVGAREPGDPSEARPRWHRCDCNPKARPA